MPEHDLIKLFVEPINKLGVRYMLTGSVAAVIYGEPRLTHDVDIVIELGAAQLDEVLKIFPPQDFSAPPIEVMRLESQRTIRGHCNIIHFESGLKADLYFLGKDPLHHWAIELRREIEVAGEQIWIAPPEYVILRKLLFFREGGSQKHLRDIRLILDHSSELISFPVLNEKISVLGIAQEWELALKYRV